jgi:hypothetical protein
MRGEGFAEARKVRAVREENTQEWCEVASIEIAKVSQALSLLPTSHETDS